MVVSKDSTDRLLPVLKIRVDADSQIGLGHLIRSIALANMLQIHWCCHFHLIGAENQVLALLDEEGFSYVDLVSEEVFFDNLKPEDVVLLDGYGFDLAYQEKVNSICSGLICIDDIPDRHFAADLVINHSPGVSEKDYSTERHTKVLLGPDFALLRPAFLNAAPTEDRQGVFLCIGGADPLNFTGSLVKLLLEINDHLPVEVVVGGSNKHWSSEMIKEFTDTGRVHFHSNLNAGEMAGLMTRCQFAVVPASGILMEALACGLSPLIGYFVDNQVKMHQAWSDLGGYSLGDFREFEKVADQLRFFDFSEPINESPMKKLIDGKSGERLLKIINDEFS